MAGALRHLLSPTETEAPAGSDREVSAPATDGAPPAWVSRLIESQRRQITGHVGDARGDLVAFSYEPDRGCFFNGDDPLQLIRQVPGLLALHVDAREPWPRSRSSIRSPAICDCRAIATGRHAELANIFRLVPDQVRIVAVPLAAARLDQERDAGESDTDRPGAGGARGATTGPSRCRPGRRPQRPHRRGGARRRQRAALWPAAGSGEDIERAGAAALSARSAAALLSALEQALAALVADAPAGDPGLRCGFRACPGAGAGAPREPCAARR